ncbi:MAG: carbohydrate ABC transporter permease, partial [Actinopolymorphaceae bacterium]
EAADLDGASRWQRLRHVTIPLLIPATTIAMSLTLISGLKMFDQVFVMTSGGPGYATETLSLLMYKEAFVSGRYGYSTAIALVLTMIVFAFAMLQLKALRRFEVDA